MSSPIPEGLSAKIGIVDSVINDLESSGTVALKSTFHTLFDKYAHKVGKWSAEYEALQQYRLSSTTMAAKEYIKLIDAVLQDPAVEEHLAKETINALKQVRSLIGESLGDAKTHDAWRFSEANLGYMVGGKTAKLHPLQRSQVPEDEIAEHASEITDKIEALEVGDSILLPAGSFSHQTYYLIKRTSDDSYKLYEYDTARNPPIQELDHVPKDVMSQRDKWTAVHSEKVAGSAVPDFAAIFFADSSEKPSWQTTSDIPLEMQPRMQEEETCGYHSLKAVVKHLITQANPETSQRDQWKLFKSLFSNAVIKSSDSYVQQLEPQMSVFAKEKSIVRNRFLLFNQMIQSGKLSDCKQLFIDGLRKVATEDEIEEIKARYEEISGNSPIDALEFLHNSLVKALVKNGFKDVKVQVQLLMDNPETPDVLRPALQQYLDCAKYNQSILSSMKVCVSTAEFTGSKFHSLLEAFDNIEELDKSDLLLIIDYAKTVAPAKGCEKNHSLLLRSLIERCIKSEDPEVKSQITPLLMRLGTIDQGMVMEFLGALVDSGEVELTLEITKQLLPFVPSAPEAFVNKLILGLLATDKKEEIKELYKAFQAKLPEIDAILPSALRQISPDQISGLEKLELLSEFIVYVQVKDVAKLNLSDVSVDELVSFIGRDKFEFISDRQAIGEGIIASLVASGDYDKANDFAKRFLPSQAEENRFILNSLGRLIDHILANNDHSKNKDKVLSLFEMFITHSKNELYGGKVEVMWDRDDFRLDLHYSRHEANNELKEEFLRMLDRYVKN